MSMTEDNKGSNVLDTYVQKLLSKSTMIESETATNEIEVACERVSSELLGHTSSSSNVSDETGQIGGEIRVIRKRNAVPGQRAKQALKASDAISHEYHNHGAAVAVDISEYDGDDVIAGNTDESPNRIKKQKIDCNSSSSSQYSSSSNRLKNTECASDNADESTDSSDSDESIKDPELQLAEIPENENSENPENPENPMTHIKDMKDMKGMKGISDMNQNNPKELTDNRDLKEMKEYSEMKECKAYKEKEFKYPIQLKKSRAGNIASAVLAANPQGRVRIVPLGKGYEFHKKALLRYKELFGDMIVRHTFIVPWVDTWDVDMWGLKLGQLVCIQIRNQEKYKEHRDDLIEIGFNYHRQKVSAHGFEKVKSALIIFKEINHHTTVPNKFVVPSIIGGEWPEKFWGLKLHSVLHDIKRGHAYSDENRQELIEIGYGLPALKQLE